MKKVAVALAGLLLAGASQAYTVNTNSFPYGGTWDNPSQTLHNVLSGIEDQEGTNLTLNLINEETFTGTGTTTVILEEIAGYRNRTTFGWYEVGNTSNFEQIFSGTDDKNTDPVSIDFGSLMDIGFYIDPNGSKPNLNYYNRMFTESSLNTHQDTQVAIFEIEELTNTYILGWEDLDLNGGNGGDRDFQDMIVRVKITNVTEPSTLALFGLGLLGLVATRRNMNK